MLPSFSMMNGKEGNLMKYNVNNKPLVCMQTNSKRYKETSKMTIKGVLWHSTGVNNKNVKRYVQPSENDPNYDELIKILGKNANGNDWNHKSVNAGLNAWIGQLADGSVAAVQTMPWNYKPWGCGKGSKGSCNNGWIQFEICEDSLTDATYFNKVYKEACELTAYLCKMYNLDPNGTATLKGVEVPVILCHADSHKLGLGSNHGDVLHWFKKYGKTMDDVRKDVMALMGNPSISSSSQSATLEIYRVRKSWKDSESQIGAYKNLKNAKAACDKAGRGYYVFNIAGTAVYPEIQFTPYKVKVMADALRIRKGAGTNYVQVGTIRDKGVYTIIDEATGKGATKWGLLKSGEKKRNKWISLDYTKRI